MRWFKYQLSIDAVTSHERYVFLYNALIIICLLAMEQHCSTSGLFWAKKNYRVSQQNVKDRLQENFLKWGGFAKTAFEDELRTWHPSTTIVSKTVDFGSWLMQAVWFQEPGRAWGWSKDFKALRRSSWKYRWPKIKLRRSLRNRAEHIIMSTLGAIGCRDTIFGIHSNATIQFPPTEEENTYFEHSTIFYVEQKCFGFLSLWLPQWALI